MKGPQERKLTLSGLSPQAGSRMANKAIGGAPVHYDPSPRERGPDGLPKRKDTRTLDQVVADAMAKQEGRSI
jgi:hypothetical protein